MALKMTILVENHLSPHAAAFLQPRVGLTTLLDDGESRILFDTGPDETFIHNAGLINVPLTDPDAVVLSHRHYDHSGGRTSLIPGTRIICHPDVIRERYADIRLPRKVIPLNSERFRGLNVEYCQTPGIVAGRFIWSGEVPVETPEACL